MSDIKIYDVEQGTNEWLALRLGKFTASKIGLLMSKGRSETFSKTAQSYIFEVAAERNIAEWVQGSMDEWFERTKIFASALQYGTDNEEYARDAYEEKFGFKVSQVGFVERESIKGFGDSPDGIVKSEKGVIELKCPKNPAIHLQFGMLKSADDLKAFKPEYYYQCYAHLLATGAEWCDFSSFDMYQKQDLYTLRIMPDDDIFKEIKERISLANDEVDRIFEIINKVQPSI